MQFTINALIFFTLLTVATLPCGSAPQSDSAGARRAQEMLIDRQIANQEAQTTYYRKQIESMANKREKSLWENIEENPATIAAFVASMIAIITFAMNYLTTLRNQSDTQFYEALKRFGDKDSPAIRSSAAGLLAQMSKEKLRWHFAGGLPLRYRPYLATTIDQLIAGLGMEEDAIVLDSIGGALHRIIESPSMAVIETLYKQNQALQLQLFGDLCNLQGAYKSPYTTNLSSDVVQTASTITGQPPSTLSTLVGRFDINNMTTMIKSRQPVIDQLSPESYSSFIESAQNNLGITIWRMDQNTRILALAISRSRPKNSLFGMIVRKNPKAYTMPPLHRAFLVQASLDNIKLDNISLEDAQLQNISFKHSTLSHVSFRESYLDSANFSGAELHSVNFMGADLRGGIFTGTTFTHTDLQGANLIGATGDESTTMDHSAWWKAIYSSPPISDSDILVALYKRYAATCPDPSGGEVSASVAAYIKSRQPQ